jgi:GMP synthase-like glutamine amidotransferase
MQHNVLILDFGSQYTQLIARRVRELNIFCEIFQFDKIPADLSSYKAVILGGSPCSVRSEEALHPDLSQIRGKMPLLAVCYGAQYLAHFSSKESTSSPSIYHPLEIVRDIASSNSFLSSLYGLIKSKNCIFIFTLIYFLKIL